jgi:hypothetical protein
MKLKVFLASLILAASFSVQAAQDTVLALSARTATTTSSNITKTTEKSAHFVINVTVVPGVDTITPKIQAMDNLGNYYDLLVGAAISTTGITVLKIAQGGAVIAGGAAADFMPDVYRVVVTPSAGTSFTYSVTVNKSN